MRKTVLPLQTTRLTNNGRFCVTGPAWADQLALCVSCAAARRVRTCGLKSTDSGFGWRQKIADSDGYIRTRIHCLVIDYNINTFYIVHVIVLTPQVLVNNTSTHKRRYCYLPQSEGDGVLKAQES